MTDTHHITVVTNWRPRDVIDAWDLTYDERAPFDYVDWNDIEAGRESRQFVRYKGELIDLGDVPRAEGAIAEMGWDGFNSDSFYSGTAIRYVDNFERVIVARIYT